MSTPMRMVSGFSSLGRFCSLASLVGLAACGSGSQSPPGSGGMGTASGGASATGGAGSGGNSGSGGSGSGGAATGGASSGGTSGGSGGAATGGANGTGGRAGTGGVSGSGGRANGGATGTGGRSNTGGGTATGGTSGGAFTVTSPGWVNMAGCAANMSSSCATLPTEITRSGAGTSPELNWTGAPAGTKSFAVVLQDLSGPSTHWVIWNIPATVTSLPANVDRTTAMPATPAGSQQCGKGTDAATKFGYIGPGAPCNVYEFMVYALGVTPFPATSTTDPAMVRTQLNSLPASSLLGTAAIRGRTNMTCSN